MGWETEVTTPKSDSDGLVALDAATVAVLREPIGGSNRPSAWLGVRRGSTSRLRLHHRNGPDDPSGLRQPPFRPAGRHANQLKLGSQGQAVEVSAALGIEPKGVYGQDTRRAVFVFQQEQDPLIANGIVDPATWYRLFPDEPLRPYPHPGYLPPIRLHDLRHLAASLALTGRVEMKGVSEMLRTRRCRSRPSPYTRWYRRWPGQLPRRRPDCSAPDLSNGASDATSTSLARGPRKGCRSSR